MKQALDGVVAAPWTLMLDKWRMAVFNGDLTPAKLDSVEPQFVASREVGYRYNGKKVAVDVSAHWSKYTNFIAAKNVVTPLYGSVSDLSGAAAIAAGDFSFFSVDNNTDEEVNVMGLTAGLDSKIGKFDFRHDRFHLITADILQ